MIITLAIINTRTRNWTEIAAAILYSAAESPITKTKIMSKAYISYDQTVRYIADLTTGYLLEPVQDRYFKTSDTGFQFLKVYERLQDLTPEKCRGNLGLRTINDLLRIHH